MSSIYENAVSSLLQANSTVTAVTIVDGAGGVLYQTSNWDITSDIITLLNSWRQQQPSIVVQGIKYSTLQCTPERLVAINVMGQGHIVCSNWKDQHIMIAYVTPDGGASVAYMDVARANDSIGTGAAAAGASYQPVGASQAPGPTGQQPFAQQYQQPADTTQPMHPSTTQVEQPGFQQPVPSSSWASGSQDTDMKNLLWELDEFNKFVTRGEFGQFLQVVMQEGDQVKCWELLKIIRSLKSFMGR